MKRLFQELNYSIDKSHQDHLNTHKYSKHKAFEEYYEEMRELLDKAIEAWKIDNDEDIELTGFETKFEGKDIYWFQDLRKYIHKKRSSGELDELYFDDMLECVNKLIYQLTHLTENLEPKNNKKPIKNENYHNPKGLLKFILEAENDDNKDDTEESIQSKDDLIDYMKNKFKEVFGDDLDKERMEFTIKGFLDDNKEKVEEEDWGTLVGMFNKSF